MIAKGLGVTVGQYAAAAQTAVKAQWTADIHVAVIVVVTTATDAHFGGQFMSRALADHVDSGGRITRTGGQARGAAHQLDAVINDRVGVGFHVAECVEHPVDLKVLDGIAPG